MTTHLLQTSACGIRIALYLKACFYNDYTPIADFVLEDVMTTRPWRAQIWDENVKEDFLDPWISRFGNQPGPRYLMAEYYESVLSEMRLNQEPSTSDQQPEIPFSI